MGDPGAESRAKERTRISTILIADKTDRLGVQGGDRIPKAIEDPKVKVDSDPPPNHQVLGLCTSSVVEELPDHDVETLRLRHDARRVKLLFAKLQDDAPKPSPRPQTIPLQEHDRRG